MDTRLEFLKSVRPFNLLPQQVLADIAQALEEIRYSKEGIIIVQEITQIKGIDIIVEGEYESFFYDSSQNKRVVEHHHSGDIYGGLSILLNRKRSIRTVLAKKGTVIYRLPRKEFRVLCQNYEDFFHYFTSDFGKRMLNDEFAHFFKPPTAFEESFIATDQIYSRKIEGV